MHPSLLFLVGLSLQDPDLAVRTPRTWLRPVTAPVREATVRLDRATGLFHRVPSSIADGPKEIVYNNNCPGGYHFGQSSVGGSQVFAIIDEGRLPSTAAVAMGTAGFYYQIWFRNTPASFCMKSGFNLSNGQRLFWP